MMESPLEVFKEIIRQAKMSLAGALPIDLGVNHIFLWVSCNLILWLWGLGLLVFVVFFLKKTNTPLCPFTQNQILLFYLSTSLVWANFFPKRHKAHIFFYQCCEYWFLVKVSGNGVWTFLMHKFHTPYCWRQNPLSLRQECIWGMTCLLLVPLHPAILPLKARQPPSVWQWDCDHDVTDVRKPVPYPSWRSNSCLKFWCPQQFLMSAKMIMNKTLVLF